MLSSTQHQPWLFYTPLAKQAALLKDDLLEPVDQLLDDSLMVDLVRDCLAKRWPASTRTGRPGIAPDRLLRCCVLKHLKGGASATWNANYAVTWFTGASPTMTPKLRRTSPASVACSPCWVLPSPRKSISAWSKWRARVACESGVAQGRKLKTD